MEKLYTIFDKYRIEKHMSVAQFARLIGVPYRVTYNAIKGKVIPRDYHRSAFEKFFNANKKEIYQCLGMQDENTKTVLQDLSK